MPETKVVQMFFRRHFVTPPTENGLQYKNVNIQHNLNMYESIFYINIKHVIIELELSQKRS